jgi:hypothetical protein
MPSYLDFDTTKNFRDYILGKTLQSPNGPQTSSSSNYAVQSLSNMSNVDPGTVENNLPQYLVNTQNGNIFKPLQYSVRDGINTLPRRANLNLYPYFERDQDHNLIGILTTSNYDNESELFKFASSYIKTDPQGPLLARIQQNLYAATVGRVRLIDALQGNTTTAINIITGREPLVEGNTKITVAKTLPGKAIDFVQTVVGVEFPWSEIPGDYLSNPRNPVNYRPEAKTELGKIYQDVTGALGSLIGIDRRPKVSRKPSDLMIEYLGSGQKIALFDNLSYSKYGPNYTTTARSQNSSKLFNFIDNLAQGVKNVLGVEAPTKYAYIGDDRSDDVKYAMNDFNDRPVRSNYYLSVMFDPIQADLFGRKRNISEGGGIGGKLTWISRSSKNKLGVGNKEFPSEKSQFSESLSTNYNFRNGSILDTTQDILDSMPTNGAAARSHVANVIDQTSRIFKEGDTMMSRGSAVKYVDKFTKEEGGIEYCRVWTKDRSYMNNSDTMKRTGLIRKYGSSVLTKPWNLNIAPMSNGNKDFGPESNIVKGKGDGFYAKKYMFSIENLAWKTSNLPGFSYNDLPYCERGPNGGRVMWFPPYDLKISENNSAKWETNTFLGRPEPVYTYQNTERTGQISFKIVVDHPSVLNLLVREHFKGMSDEESENYINAFFAGCQDVDFYDLIRKYVTLSQTDITTIQAFLNGNNDPQTITQFTSVTDPIENPGTPDNGGAVPNTDPNKTDPKSFSATLYFPNDYPTKGSSKGDLYSDTTYQKEFDHYMLLKEGEYKKELNQGLDNLLVNGTWGPKSKKDYKILFGKESPTKPNISEVPALKTEVEKQIDDAFNELSTTYPKVNEKYEELKKGLTDKTVKDIKIKLSSTTSAVADDNYNLKLAYRRSYSIITDLITKISKDGTTTALDKVKWKNVVTTKDKSAKESAIEISLKDFGYTDNEGKFTIEYVSNIGEQLTNGSIGSHKNVDCSDNKLVTTSNDLKRTAPITFWCRETTFEVNYSVKPPDVPATTPPPSITEVPKTRLVPYEEKPKAKDRKPSIDPLKNIVMKVLSECHYFKILEEDSPVQFNSLKEKLRYFHPGFHSTTPEGLNSRLTFLQQCIRPGDTIPIKGISDESDINARNTTFGPPPICVLRVGDFYHSKIIIRDVNFSFDEGTWDLNPEGIGVQPMIATATLSISFIGGQGMEKPVERLQNALSSNFFANSEVYDPRATATEDRSKFTKEFLQTLNLSKPSEVKPNAVDALTQTNKVTEGKYIGTLNDKTLDYTDLVKQVFKDTENYTKTYITGYNNIVKQYGDTLSSMFLSPTYRTIRNYTVQTGAGTETIQLFGDYVKNKELSVMANDFKQIFISKIESESMTEMFKFDRDMTEPVVKKSEEILKPFIIKKVSEMIDTFSSNKSIVDIEKSRNDLILTLDKVNFLVETGHDGKVDKDQYIGAELSGFTYDKLYSKYDNNIKFIRDKQSKFYEDLDDSYIFESTSTMTTEDMTNFLSILLKDSIQEIKGLYTKDETIFTKRILADIEKRLNKFMVTPKEKDLKVKKYPIQKDSNKVSFNITNETFTFNDTQKEQLVKVNTTGKVKSTDTLNYVR